MASNSSFDVVSDFEWQELVNTIDQTQREIKARYDLKNTATEITLDKEGITIHTDSDFTLTAIHSILQTKAVKRQLSLKIFDYGTPEPASGNRVRQQIAFKRGIPSELAKKITKLIRDDFKKVQSAIQGDAVRVSAKSKDDLQQVMQRLKQEDWPVALQFTNYR
ncbi:YajQ family cyclic di-GMP-binding protein [Synechococcales cyanobacterium C]|uniref:Nucleotide-binding protein GS597_16540 n=1 Tax=Petrachloros mirabilis ULC683 TaxID=2781853 RepID=A0A8K1ZZA7_9CYAN|nr:YajQ family cyclic di-GMP-binding protein [Petrachloros mirabilis]NCJ08085.1 YajQ family cyclic di-GMP-binding protein [Petrachloros mirabilis ULC683]